MKRTLGFRIYTFMECCGEKRYHPRDGMPTWVRTRRNAQLFATREEAEEVAEQGSGYDRIVRVVSK